MVPMTPRTRTITKTVTIDWMSMHVADEYQIQLEQEVQMASYSHRLLHVWTSTPYPML